jgi:hypothetical protein
VRENILKTHNGNNVDADENDFAPATNFFSGTGKRNKSAHPGAKQYLIKKRQYGTSNVQHLFA